MSQWKPKYLVLHDYAAKTKFGVRNNPYHVLVHEDGQVQYRNPVDPYGRAAEHAYKLNPYAIGLSWGGPYGGTPSPEAYKSLKNEYERINKLFPGLEVMSHGEAFAKRGKIPRASKAGRDLTEASWRKYIRDGEPYPGLEPSEPAEPKPTMLAGASARYLSASKPEAPPEGQDISQEADGPVVLGAGAEQDPKLVQPPRLAERPVNEDGSLNIFRPSPQGIVEPFKPKTVEEALEYQNRVLNPDDGISWAQAAYAMGQTNWTFNNFQHYVLTDPVRAVEDPNFKVNDEMLKDVPEWQIDYVRDAVNQKDFDLRIAEAKSRDEGMKQWGKMSWSQYLSLYAADVGIDLMPAIALTAGTGAALRGASASYKRLEEGSRLSRALALALEGGVATSAEMGATYGSGQITGAEATVYTALGTLLAAGVGAAFIPKKRRVALAEAVEDTLDKVAPPKPSTVQNLAKDHETEIMTSGAPARVKINEDMSSVVHREHNAEAAKVAVRNYDTDMDRIAQSLDTGKVGVKGDNKAMKISEAFKRQATILQEPETVYIAVPNRFKDLNAYIKDGMAVASRSVDEAVYPLRSSKQGFRVYEVPLEKGSKVIRGEDFGLNKNRVLFGSGKLKEGKPPSGKAMPKREKLNKTKTPKGRSVEIPVLPAKFTPEPTKGKVTKQFARGFEKGNNRLLTPDELDAINAELIIKGWDNSSLLQRGASVGAARLEPNRFAFQDLPKEMRDMINYIKETGDVPDIESSFMDLPMSISRGAKLMNSPNPVVRQIVPYLMDGLIELSKKELEAGKARPRAVDAVRRRLVNSFDGKLMKNHREHYKKYKADFRKEKGYMYHPAAIQEEFETKVAEYTRARNDGLDPEVHPSVKAHADFLAKDFYPKLLDMLANPGIAVGKALDENGEQYFRPIANMDQVKDAAKNIFGYIPRNWHGPAISRMQAEYGPDALYQYLKGNLSETLKHTKLAENPGLINKMAKGMSNTILKSKGDWNTWTDAAFGRADGGELIKMIKASGVDIADDEMDALKMFIQSTKSSAKETAGTATHNKVFLTESLPVSLRYNGRRFDATLNDFTQTNATLLARDYLHKTSGRIALGTLEVPGIKPGTTLVRGITSDEEWAKLMEQLGQAQTELVGLKSGAGWLSDESIFNNYYQIQTHTYPNQTPQWLQGLKMFNSFRYLGQAGFAQLPETVNAFSMAPTAMAMRMPDFAKAAKTAFMGLRKVPDADFQGPLGRLIEDDLGIGADVVRAPGSARFDNLSTSFEGLTAGDKRKYYMGRAMMNTLEGAQNHALTYSGLLPFTSAGQKTLMMALHDQMMGWAKKYATNKLPRRFRDQLKNAGLTDAEIDAALVMYRNEDIVKPQQGTVFKKVEDIDQSHPAFDGELFWKVKDAFARMTTQAIQENKWGMMPPGWDHPVTRMLFQIRSFMVGSITAQLINNTRKMGSTVARGIRDVQAGNLSMEDGLGDSMMDLMRVGGSTVGQSISGIMGYVALQAMYAQTMTDDEAERHWEKIWDVEHLALAAVSRSGWLGSIPFIYDSTVGMVTGTKFAGYRSSGLAEDVFGNPTFGMFRDITRVVQGVTGDDDMDAKDAQNVQKMFTNMWYANLGTMFVSRNVFGLEAPESRDDPVSLIGRLMGKED